MFMREIVWIEGDIGMLFKLVTEMIEGDPVHVGH